MITLWTDGSAEPNPGLGGYAVIEDGEPVALGREEKSTNIRMEAMALIAAMEYAKGQPCTIYTDSEFWRNVLTKWAPGWEMNGWRKKRGEIKNLELVQKAHRLYQQGNINLIWVKAHAGTKYNELADEWANKARIGFTLDDIQKEGV